MRIFRVYHKTEFMYRYTEAADMTVFQPKDYDWVAEVHTESIDDVFQLTNHIDTEWWTNDEVKQWQPRSRSTSVGDVVYDVDADSYHLCMPVGWKKLSVCKECFVCDTAIFDSRPERINPFADEYDPNDELCNRCYKEAVAESDMRDDEYLRSIGG